MRYRVIMRAEIERCVEANSEEEALAKVDKGEMMHELKHYRVDEDWIVKKDIMFEDDE